MNLAGRAIWLSHWNIGAPIADSNALPRRNSGNPTTRFDVVTDDVDGDRDATKV
jgi:hypothetical protein